MKKTFITVITSIIITLLMVTFYSKHVSADTVTSRARRRYQTGNTGTSGSSSSLYNIPSRNQRRFQARQRYSGRRYSGASRRQYMRNRSANNRRRYGNRRSTTQTYRPRQARTTPTYRATRVYMVIKAGVTAMEVQNKLNKYAKLGWRFAGGIGNKIVFER